MGPTALLPFRRKACLGFFRPEKSWRLRPGLNPRTWVLRGSTLPLGHRSRYSFTYMMYSLNPSPLWDIYRKNTNFIYAPFTVGTMNTCNMIELNLERLSTEAVKFYILLLKYRRIKACWKRKHAAVLYVNSLNAALNPICHLPALLGAQHIFHVRG